MPYLCIHTNTEHTEDDQARLLTAASSLVANRLGKAERYVMVAFAPKRPMHFAGSDAPCAYLELKSIGLDSGSTAALSQALCDLIAAHLGIEAARVYIEFSDAPWAMWGWNGATF